MGLCTVKHTVMNDSVQYKSRKMEVKSKQTALLPLPCRAAFQQLLMMQVVFNFSRIDQVARPIFSSCHFYMATSSSAWVFLFSNCLKTIIAGSLFTAHLCCTSVCFWPYASVLLQVLVLWSLPWEAKAKGHKGAISNSLLYKPHKSDSLSQRWNTCYGGEKGKHAGTVLSIITAGIRGHEGFHSITLCGLAWFSVSAGGLKTDSSHICWWSYDILQNTRVAADKMNTGFLSPVPNPVRISWKAVSKLI